MAIKHKRFKPLRHAGVASQDRLYISGAAIVEGAPLVFSSGKVIEATDDDAGAAGPLVGIALNAVSGANQDVLVALPLPWRRFIGSLTDVAASAASDGGTKALALADIGTVYELHKDDTTGIWVLGGTGGANASARVTALVDPIGATTDDDTPQFGSAGGGPGVPMTTTPYTTESQDPTGSNTGQGLVEFIIQIEDTIL